MTSLTESFPLSPAVQQNLLALGRMLRRSNGSFGLALARCNTVPLRAQLVDALRDALAPANVSVHEVELDADTADIPAALAEVPGGSAPLFVYGLERTMPSRSPDWTLAQLNERRPLYQKLGRPLVFWLPEYALNLIAWGAPDFWAWRSGVYEFSLPDAGREALMEREVRGVDWVTQRNLDRAAAEARLHLLRGLLGEYIGESENARYARAETLFKLADLERTLVGYNVAEPRLREALRIYEGLGDQRNVITIQDILARVLRSRGEYEEAEQLFCAAIKASEQLDDKWAVAVIQSELAYLYVLQGEYERAERLYRASLETKEQLGDRREVAVTQGQLAEIYRLRGEYEGAERLYRASLETKEQLGDRREVAVTQGQLADLYSLRGEYEGAEWLYRASLETKEQLGDRRGVAVTQGQLAALYRLRGEYKEAEQLYRTALETSEQLGDRRGVAVTLHNLALMRRDQGRTEEALELLTRSRDINIALGLDKDIARVENLIAEITAQKLPNTNT